MVAAAKSGYLRRFYSSLLVWFDSAGAKKLPGTDNRRVLPFIAMHVACLGVIWVGWSPLAVGTAIGLYLLRMFAITGFYHRYFSHRSFKTTRSLQFIFAVIGASSVQRGPIWWAAHHRQHHAATEGENDPHSPVQHGLWWSHTGWFLSREYFDVPEKRVRDLLRYPELRFLHRFDIVIPALLAVFLLLTGNLCATPEYQRRANAGMGFLCINRGAVPWNVHY